VQRYLNDEAVEACPPTAAYRLKPVFDTFGTFFDVSLYFTTAEQGRTELPGATVMP